MPHSHSVRHASIRTLFEAVIPASVQDNVRRRALPSRTRIQRCRGTTAVARTERWKGIEHKVVYFSSAIQFVFRCGCGAYAGSACGKGVYTSWSAQSRCSNTASFRATATTAQRLERLPPRAAIRSP